MNGEGETTQAGNAHNNSSDSSYIRGGETMLRLQGNSKTLCDGLTRRDLLHVGGLGAFGLDFQDVLGSKPAHAKPAKSGSKFGRAKSCSLIYKVAVLR